MSNLLYYLEVAATFLAMLMVLVAAHELGHYLFARLFGMGVEEFSVGMFGKRPLVTYARRRYRIPVEAGQNPYHVGAAPGVSFEGGTAATHEPPVVLETPKGPTLEETTDFTIRPWPVGGFVRIKGMVPEEDGGETRIPGGFYSKAPWKRIIVLLAGPAFSILTGVLILIPVFMFDGIPKPPQKPVLGAIVKGSAADKADLHEGDRVLTIDGVPVQRWFDVVQKVRDTGGRAVTVAVERDGHQLTKEVIPMVDAKPSPVFDENLEPTGETRRLARLGAYPPPGEMVRLPFGEAVAEATRFPIVAVKNIVGLFRRPAEFKDNVGGPGRMVEATAEAVSVGPVSVVKLAALLSISVGIFNLLPVFPLDGGQIVVAIAEMLRGGRRLSIGLQNTIGTVGFGLVLLLVAGVLFSDANHFLHPEKPLETVEAGQKTK